MNKFLLNKEEFIKIIEEIKKTDNYQNGLNNYFRKNDVDGYIFQPDCVPTSLRLLHIIFGEADKDNWIEYFCFELDYGRKWKAGMITEKDGTDIVLDSADSLYEFLCNYDRG